jgi:hypothetical protein
VKKPKIEVGQELFYYSLIHYGKKVLYEDGIAKVETFSAENNIIVDDITVHPFSPKEINSVIIRNGPVTSAYRAMMFRTDNALTRDEIEKSLILGLMNYIRNEQDAKNKFYYQMLQRIPDRSIWNRRKGET